MHRMLALSSPRSRSRSVRLSAEGHRERPIAGRGECEPFVNNAVLAALATRSM